MSNWLWFSLGLYSTVVTMWKTTKWRFCYQCWKSLPAVLRDERPNEPLKGFTACSRNALVTARCQFNVDVFWKKMWPDDGTRGASGGHTLWDKTSGHYEYSQRISWTRAGSFQDTLWFPRRSLTPLPADSTLSFCLLSRRNLHLF